MTPNEQYYFDKVPTHIMSDDPNSDMAKMWRILAKQFDDIDLMYYQIRQTDDIGKQSGVNLDNIGAKIGLTRQGRLDDVYKVLLGITTVDEEVDPDHVITTMFLLFRGENFQIENDFPAGVIVKIDKPDPVVPLAEAAGIIAQLWKFARKYTITIQEGDDGFAFLGHQGKGFDDFNAPGQGGIFSTIILSP